MALPSGFLDEIPRPFLAVSSIYHHLPTCRQADKITFRPRPGRNSSTLCYIVARSGTRGGVRGPFSPSAALAWLLQRASDRYETLREKDPDGETKIKIE